jgi:hypothetical protein
MADQFGYTTTKVTVGAREAWQRATVDASALVGKRLNQSTVLLAALAVAREHPGEWAAAITELQGDQQ